MDDPLHHLPFLTGKTLRNKGFKACILRAFASLRSLHLIGLLLLACNLSAAPDKPESKIIKTRYPTADVVVAGYNVVDFGAKGDGQSDCTEAFQTALNKMKEAGGGTVFVPEGKYAFKGSLKIPPSVTLRGEWQQPCQP